jgi:hypothetical protein
MVSTGTLIIFAITVIVLGFIYLNMVTPIFRMTLVRQSILLRQLVAVHIILNWRNNTHITRRRIADN